MIAYLPQPYEDELFYSVLCRAYTHSGYFSHKEALKDMLYTKSNNPSIEFLGHFNTDFESLISGVKAKHLSEVLPLLPRHTDANTAEAITSLINP